MDLTAHWMNSDCDALHKEVQSQYTSYRKTLAENVLHVIAITH